jgi:hypothetical protein
LIVELEKSKEKDKSHTDELRKTLIRKTKEMSKGRKGRKEPIPIK